MLDAGSVWDKSVAVLKQRLDPQIFAAWIKPLSLEKVSLTRSTEIRRDIQSPRRTEAELVAPNKFCRDHVERHYGNLISSALTDVTGSDDLVVKFKVGADLVSNLGSPRISSAPKRQSRSYRVLENNSNLNEKYNFSNFVVGKCNQLARAVSQQVAESPGTRYNPLFLYGGVGLGKTHLINAIGNACRRRGKSVLLVSSELFVNELIAALRTNKMEKFKNKFRSLDVLMIDDIQFLVGKERTQEEFFHTFNDLYHRRKQIVITSDKLPQELTGLEERLRTRFASGLNADLQVPDFETRVAILLKKAEGADIVLPDEVARLLAEKIDTNVRELEGALNRLQALSALHNSPLSLDLASTVLDTFLPNSYREVTPELIQRTVSERYNVSVKDLLGKRRTQNIAFARHVAMFICRNLTSCSYPEIGALFGGRDHSTVIHAYRVIKERSDGDENLAQDIADLTRKIETGK